jgi:hypothetical protein
MLNWITWPATLGFIGGLVAAPIGWYLNAFLFGPVRKFFDIRGQTALAMNQHARFLSGFPSIVELYPTQWDDGSAARPKAIAEFGDLGHRLIAFWQSEAVASWVLRRLGYDGIGAGRMLLSVVDALENKMSLGPRRSDLLNALRLPS